MRPAASHAGVAAASIGRLASAQAAIARPHLRRAATAARARSDLLARRFLYVIAALIVLLLVARARLEPVPGRS